MVPPILWILLTDPWWDGGVGNSREEEAIHKLSLEIKMNPNRFIWFNISDAEFVVLPTSL